MDQSLQTASFGVFMVKKRCFTLGGHSLSGLVIRLLIHLYIGKGGEKR